MSHCTLTFSGNLKACPTLATLGIPHSSTSSIQPLHWFVQFRGQAECFFPSQKCCFVSHLHPCDLPILQLPDVPFAFVRNQWCFAKDTHNAVLMQNGSAGRNT